MPEGAYNKAEFEVNSVRQLGETWGWGRGLEVDWRWVKGGREGSSWWFPGFVGKQLAFFTRIRFYSGVFVFGFLIFVETFGDRWKAECCSASGSQKIEWQRLAPDERLWKYFIEFS